MKLFPKGKSGSTQNHFQFFFGHNEVHGTYLTHDMERFAKSILRVIEKSKTGSKMKRGLSRNDFIKDGKQKQFT